MTIVSVGICDKRGKLVVSRQYVPIGQSVLLDMYTSFPKLIQPHQEHTYVQDSLYRFLYVPLDELFVVLITTKNFNIIEAQETLKLLYRVIISVIAEGVNLRNAQIHAFDLLLAFDDIISFGEREQVSVEQVNKAVRMNSASEESYRAELEKKIEKARQEHRKGEGKVK